MKKIIVFSLGLVLLLSGCGNSKSNNAKITTDESKTTNTTVTSSTSELGKRSNPVPLNEVVTFDTEYYADGGKSIPATFSLKLSNVQRGQEVYDYIMAANQFNEAAPEGLEWIMFDVWLKMDKGSADEKYYVMPSFKIIDSNGSEVNQQDKYATLSDGEKFGNKDLYENGEISGKIVKLAPTGSNVLTEFSDFNTNLFFKLD